ncbi:MAG: Polysaccharide biosynthesis protein, partial [Acidobacteriaceae bacterium]|nr:Polysaccharide biosynthesis protein [Acidobacteriaceae bacterium]
MEEKPFATATTNVLGTLQIVQAASAFGAEKMAVISTDKAVIRRGLWVRQSELQNSWY